MITSPKENRAPNSKANNYSSQQNQTAKGYSNTRTQGCKDLVGPGDESSPLQTSVRGKTRARGDQRPRVKRELLVRWWGLHVHTFGGDRCKRAELSTPPAHGDNRLPNSVESRGEIDTYRKGCLQAHKSLAKQYSLRH